MFKHREYKTHIITYNSIPCIKYSQDNNHFPTKIIKIQTINYSFKKTH
ncbi:hypothetical protein VS_II1059 [Vibrio atlanticus]|uniref:Uncharacterized protein n=1 Tax=Vibrio atlanticus (strain LGP32) TaxID=575788 RepID=B7VS40_VIBA3|nr:hypothetical protein VS_II1059 [Vibrio atlanticus]